MLGMTSHADLLAGAAEQVRTGAGPLRTDRLWSAREALDAIGDFHAPTGCSATCGSRRRRSRSGRGRSVSHRCW